MDAQPEEKIDLEAAGLIADSYDALFAIRKRIRSFDDLQLPFRDGVTSAQVGTFVLVLILSGLSLGLVGLPLMRALGLDHWLFILGWLFAPPVLASQRVLRPMAHQKSIPETISSWVRAMLDDPVHRRGRGIKTPSQPWDESVPHYQREWLMYPEYAAMEPGASEEDLTDTLTEAEFEAGGEVVDLQMWWDRRSAEQAVEAAEAKKQTVDEAEEDVSFRRGTAASVLIPDLDEAAE